MAVHTLKLTDLVDLGDGRSTLSFEFDGISTHVHVTNDQIATELSSVLESLEGCLAIAVLLWQRQGLPFSQVKNRLMTIDFASAVPILQNVVPS